MKLLSMPEMPTSEPGSEKRPPVRSMEEIRRDLEMFERRKGRPSQEREKFPLDKQVAFAILDALSESGAEPHDILDNEDLRVKVSATVRRQADKNLNNEELRTYIAALSVGKFKEEWRLERRDSRYQRKERAA